MQNLSIARYLHSLSGLCILKLTPEETDVAPFITNTTLVHSILTQHLDQITNQLQD